MHIHPTCKTYYLQTYDTQYVWSFVQFIDLQAAAFSTVFEVISNRKNTDRRARRGFLLKIAL